MVTAMYAFFPTVSTRIALQVCFYLPNDQSRWDPA